MKKYLIYLLMLFAGTSVFVSCEKDFLGKPMGSDINVDSIFSSRENAMAAIAKAYASCAAAGIHVVNSANFGSGYTLTAVSQETNQVKFAWMYGYTIQRGGMTAAGGPSGGAYSIDFYDFNWVSIRAANLVIENIDKVRDMSDEEKLQVKAEMKTLIAYRYAAMFKRYGGVPIVRNVLTADGDVKLPRESLQAVLDYIVELCDEAYPNLPRPSDLSADMNGRVTQGVALAVKAEAYLFAARPLFNSATPYLPLGKNNNLICFGTADPNRWQAVIDANQAVITWALANGYAIIDTGDPFNDYGTAVATPSNSEVLFAYKRINSSTPPGSTPNHLYDPRTQQGGANGMSLYQLKQYYKQDGTNQVWPKEDGTEAINFADYLSRMDQMEARYKASVSAPGIFTWNNAGVTEWNIQAMNGCASNDNLNNGEQCGKICKFWFKAGSRRWFEFPIYRLAQFYLSQAEAYNEIGNAPSALTNLNKIRHRAGLPDVTETDKDKLRKIIQREWAVEFMGENHAIFDIKHWKRDDIDDGVLGGPRKSLWFEYIPGRTWAADATQYVATSSVSVRERVADTFWSPSQYLCPIPQREINKGYLVQNPGY